MRYTTRIGCFILCWLPAAVLSAQSVLYSSSFAHAPATHFDIVGRVGNFFWTQKSRTNTNAKKWIAPWITDTDFSLEVYDARLNRVAVIPYTVADTVLKQYLVAGANHFDQLLITRTAQRTGLVLNRFSPNGDAVTVAVPPLQFPESLQANDFLLAASPERNNLLLLAFEPVEDAAPRVHVLLFNSNWNVLFQTVYTDRNFTQPFFQYDFTNVPLQAFDNSPVKLASNGDWLMLAAARQKSDYLLFHFQHADSSFRQSEIQFTLRTAVQYVSLFMDNAKNEAIAGLLLNTNTPAVKKARVVHYILSQGRFDFDTTYRFRTAAITKTKATEQTLYEQAFVPVPGKGFLFLKEYGRPYEGLHQGQNGSDPEEASAATDPLPVAFNKGDYTRHGQLSGLRAAYDRGDLSLYYIPATGSDSCWSGIINKTQTGELNSSFLSYACVPMRDRIVFLYNDQFYSYSKSGGATILDRNGRDVAEGVVFWKPNHMLDFQRARQIAADELAVPYEKSRGRGFAVIRLH